MSSKIKTPNIPYDIYESPQEIFIVVPLWWVNKKSINLELKDYRLCIHWERVVYNTKDDLIPLKQECYRWPIELQIDLPPHVYFDKIHSKLTDSNILEIIIPKSLSPDQIKLEIEYE